MKYAGEFNWLDVAFFSGREPCLVDDGVGDIIHVDAPDTYLELPSKTYQIAKYAKEHGYTNWIKVDDDTFLMPIPEYIKAIISDTEAIGHQRHIHQPPKVDYLQGGFYCLPSAGIQAVLDHPEFFKGTGIEDGAVGRALMAAGVPQRHEPRIVTNWREGFPQNGNDIITTHYAKPDNMHRIMDHCRLRLLAELNNALNKIPTGGVIPADTVIPQHLCNIGEIFAPVLAIPHGFDLFDTLVACRQNDRAGEHLDSLYPIKENVDRVRPNDIVISDYYTDIGAEAALLVTGLKNELIVTDGDKMNGKLFPKLKDRIVKHHGDHPIADVQRPKEAGIEAELITTSKVTAPEQFLIDKGMEGLAMACREARLRTYNAKFRALELIQIELNFPILVLAAIRLHEIAETRKAKILLMTARDCCLWTQLQKHICERLGGHYEVEYFPSSRVVRNVPSQRYMEELDRRLKLGGIIVDVGGTGKSVARLLLRSSYSQTTGLVICKYNWTNIDGYGPIDTRNIIGLTNISDNMLENVNVAQHDMFVDYDQMAKTDFDWNREEIRVMHDAFNAALAALPHQPLPPYRQDVLEHLIRSVRPMVGHNLDFLHQVVRHEDVVRVAHERPEPKPAVFTPPPAAKVTRHPQHHMHTPATIYVPKVTNNDLVVSVIRGHNWRQASAYTVSLAMTGYKGEKLIFAENIDRNSQIQLSTYGFKVMSETFDPRRFVTRDRFRPVVQYLQDNWKKHRNVIWTDVRDVIFQTDPGLWLEKHLAPSRLLGCSECLIMGNDPVYNGPWVKNSFPNDPAKRELVNSNEILCGGTVAGDAEAITQLLTALYDMCSSSITMNDQTALNYLLRTEPFASMTRIPKMDEGFTATCSWLFGIGNQQHGHQLTDKVPVFDRSTTTVKTPNGKTPFAIVHQYDREPVWNAMTQRKYVGAF